ncbi:MAG: glycosyltransferase [Rhabdochlamydiaceae bacterium]|nr:glycosyltransferase [Candidatus Amphrikana amoebophyrae]
MFRFILVFSIFCSSLLLSSEKRATICLSMIVKNEATIIEECLESLKDVIDYWVIFDTGSTDGTQEVIKNYMKGIPGELHEAPWVNFAYNRNQALAISKQKADYSLFIDADERVIQDGFKWRDNLTAQTYIIDIHHGNTICKRKFLVRNDLDWVWEGAIHEYAVCSIVPTRVVLSDAHILSHTDISARARNPDKYLHDAWAIEKVLEVNPDSARYVGFLAQSYFLANEFEKAYEAYDRRIKMGGWEQEVFISMVQKAVIEQKWGYDPKIFMKNYCDSFKYRQSRAEPLYYIANYYLQNNLPLISYLVSNYGMKISIPSDTVHVSTAVYSYAMQLIRANSAFQLGDYRTALNDMRQVYKEKNAPQTILDAVEFDLALFK